MEGKDISLGDIVKEIGVPEQQIVYMDTVERYRLIGYVLFPSRGIVLLSVRNLSPARKLSNEGNLFSKDDYVNSVYYFEPGSLQEVMTNGTLSALDPQMLPSLLEPWPGFQNKKR